MTSKKLLIASADSMGTDLITHYNKFIVRNPNITSKGNLEPAFPVWPVLLSEKLHLNCINVSIPGIGNRAIFEKCIKEVSKHKSEDIGLVVVMWSEFFRVDIRSPRYSEYYRVQGNDSVCKIIFEGHYKKQLSKIATYEYMRMLVDLNFTYIYGLQQFLKGKNIDYIMISGLDPVTGSNNMDKIGVVLHDSWKKYLGEHMLKSHYFDLIDHDRYIGFPGFQKLSGFSYCNYLASIDKDKTKTRLGHAFKNIGLPFDMHPNAYGHKLGAELIYENYQKIN